MSGNVDSENVEVVRKAIWAFENDADVFESMQSSEGVWFPFEDNHSPSYGIEGAMRIRSHWLEAWDEYRSEIEDVVAEGENVVVSLHVIGRGKASRVPVDVRIHFQFKVRDGRIAYTYEHLHRDAALKPPASVHRARR
jgi:ketosteroid isomerase-like protein